MESSAARQRGEREAPEDTKSVRLHRAQELLELLAGVVVDRRPLRAVVPDAAALDRLGDRRVGVQPTGCTASSNAALYSSSGARPQWASARFFSCVASAQPWPPAERGKEGWQKRSPSSPTTRLSQVFVA